MKVYVITSGEYSIIGKELMQIGEMNDESNVKSANGWKD